MRYWVSLSHPDEIRPGAISSGWHRVQLTSCHSGDFGKLRMSSGWHSTLTKSHPDEILPSAKSSGRLREQFSFICHPHDLLYWQWVYRLTHAYAFGTRAHPRSPHYGPFVRESNPNAALWDWYCFVLRLNNLLINQSNRQWVQNLRHSCDVTGMS